MSRIGLFHAESFRAAWGRCGLGVNTLIDPNRWAVEALSYLYSQKFLLKVVHLHDQQSLVLMPYRFTFQRCLEGTSSLLSMGLSS